MTQRICCLAVAALLLLATHQAPAGDFVHDLQAMAIGQERAPWGHWGPDAQQYSSWTSHSNRLIPIYVFGGDLRAVAGEHSIYRDAQKLQELYGRLPSETVNPEAEYFDQTDVYRLQKLAAEAGKKHIVLIVFDGMDWQTTWAAATYRAGKVAYREGRGTGLHFQDYRGTLTDFGYFVTAPNSGAARIDVDAQRIVRLSRQLGGYNAELGGPAPWAETTDPQYPIGRSEELRHMYTDSASSATSMTSGVKTYNDAINVDHGGRPCTPIARELQEAGYAVGVVTSVPISHATPGCAYANNVGRDDYQDISRDLLGLPSVSHAEPLPGVDVLLGAGWGEEAVSDEGQGENFVAGNRYLTASDLARADVENDGPYIIVQREAGVEGAPALKEAAESAKQRKKRLFGFFGVEGGHLPFRTADGAYNPARSVGGDAEVYSAEDVRENPTLADMAETALDVLDARTDRFWLMIEAGDVDWANHKNNIDNSIGAVQSGDDAFRKVTEWMERNDAWDDSLVLVTADHGHYLVLSHPEMLAQDRANEATP